MVGFARLFVANWRVQKEIDLRKAQLDDVMNWPNGPKDGLDLDRLKKAYFAARQAHSDANQNSVALTRATHIVMEPIIMFLIVCTAFLLFR